MTTRYSSAELKAIGTRNAHRLPPASAALGMFEYELHRAVEDESLFENAMIQAAKTAKEVSIQQSRLSSLVDTVKTCASHHNNERTVSIARSTHMILTHMLAHRHIDALNPFIHHSPNFTSRAN
jgi:hypothetical protein